MTIYSSMPEKEYHAHSAVSKSDLDLFAKSPATYVWAKQVGDSKPSGALSFGSMFHCCVLEPQRFHNEYICGGDLPRNTKAGKEQHAEITEIATRIGAQVVPRDEYFKCLTMKRSLEAHPEARMLFDNSFESEYSYFWIDEDTDIECRSRIDARVPALNIGIDIKTTKDIDKFHYSVIDFRYYVQAAMYTDAMLANGKDVDRFLFFVVGTTTQLGRYPVRVIELDDNAIETGRAEYKNNLQYLKRCRETGEFTGIELMGLDL